MGTDLHLGSKVIHSENGLIDVGSVIQKIRLENLNPGQEYFYRVCSKEIITQQAYPSEFMLRPINMVIKIRH